MSRKLLFALLPVFILLSGCRKAPSHSAALPTKTFTIRGKVVSTDATHVTLDHEAVPGFMEAMTMPYKVKDPTVLSELHPGDRITANLTPTGRRRLQQPCSTTSSSSPRPVPTTNPPSSTTSPSPETPSLTSQLVNQSDHTIQLGQFQGKVVLITFIYTRCPFDEYCPRMSRNFADIDKALAADPAAYSKTHLISISFDPTYDTPEVLRTYGALHRNYPTDTFTHWEFAAPTKRSPCRHPVLQRRHHPRRRNPQPLPLHRHHRKRRQDQAWYPTNDWRPIVCLSPQSKRKRCLTKQEKTSGQQTRSPRPPSEFSGARIEKRTEDLTMTMTRNKFSASLLAIALAAPGLSRSRPLPPVPAPMFAQEPSRDTPPEEFRDIQRQGTIPAGIEGRPARRLRQPSPS